MKTWHPLPYLVTKDNLLVEIQQWPEEWITALETKTKDYSIEKDTTQHEEASGKEKDEKEVEQEEKHDEGHRDPLGGREQNNESEKTKTNLLS